MEIFSARLASALRDAVTPQPVPSAKADPLRTALIKAMVAPPPPSGAPLQPAPNPALPMLPHAIGPAMQRSASAEVVLAYSTVAELGGENNADALPATVRRTAGSGVAPTGLVPGLPGIAAGAGDSQSPLLWLLPMAFEPIPPRKIAGTGIGPRKNQASAASANTADPGSSPSRIVPVSLAAAFLMAALVALVVLVVR
jgi:hypothetical protein